MLTTNDENAESVEWNRFQNSDMYYHICLASFFLLVIQWVWERINFWNDECQNDNFFIRFSFSNAHLLINVSAWIQNEKPSAVFLLSIWKMVNCWMQSIDDCIKCHFNGGCHHIFANAVMRNPPLPYSHPPFYPSLSTHFFTPILRHGVWKPPLQMLVCAFNLSH